MRNQGHTSESVTEGHPDKVCDYIADSNLDAHIAQDKESRVACEVLCKNNTVVLAGEITSEVKVDRSATYFCRYVVRQIILERVARRVEVEVSYATGIAEPFSLNVNCFGIGDEGKAIEFLKGFDLRPTEIIKEIDLLRPIYRQTTNYGHFGRSDLPWEDKRREKHVL